MDFLVDVIAALFGGRLLAERERRRARRRQDAGLVRCVARVLQGEHPGLLRKSWRATVVHLSHGLAESAWAPIEVVALDRSSARSPTAKETWSGPTPDMMVVRVNTGTAELELAFPREQFEWALATLSP